MRYDATMRTVVSLVFWGYIALSCAWLFPLALTIWLFTFWWDRRRFWLHRFSCLWAYHYAWLWPNCTIRWEGRENLTDDPVVYVSNHQSLADILVLFGAFTHFKWVSKASIFKVPFIGWNMVLNRYVRLRRGDRKSIKEMMDACRMHLEEGSAVFLFPEGTRSKDGNLRDFKHGAFTLAAKAGCRVVPIVLDGTGAILPKEGFLMDLKKTSIRVRVLPPVNPDEAGGDPEALTKLVKERIGDALQQMRAVEAA